ncbi:30S ribosomal protein THX [Flagellimonas sp. DF-77]
MGKGDIKSKRGKIINGTYGARRKRKKKKVAPAPVKKSSKKK